MEIYSTILNTISQDTILSPIMNQIHQESVECLIEKYKVTPFHYGAKLGCVSLCEMAMLKHHKINNKDYWGMTALHYAALCGHQHICFWLLTHGAILETIDHLGRTPKALAELAGHYDVADYLENEKDVLDSIVDKYFRTPESTNHVRCLPPVMKVQTRNRSYSV